MNRLMSVVLLIAIGAVGVGFYLGWFHVGSESDAGKTQITLTVDWNKMRSADPRAAAAIE